MNKRHVEFCVEKDDACFEESSQFAQDDNDFDGDHQDSDPESDLISVASSYSGISRKRRVKYSSYELNTILRECHSLIKSSEPIRVDDVEECFQKNKKLKPILKKIGLQSLVIKIRTERDRLKKINM